MIKTQYQSLIHSGKLQADALQASVCARLDILRQQLVQSAHPQSVYIYGPVGRGKSMLMDLFYNSLAISEKTRLHYHHFMKRIHDQLNHHQGETDPLLTIAGVWAQDYRVICLDEFIVEDIGDAMLLGNLWQALFSHGVTLVTTSNTPPSELYRGGLARHRFEPFIQLLERQCQIIDLDSGIDYRRLKQGEAPYYFIEQSAQDFKQQVAAHFGQLSNNKPVTIMNRDLPCIGRSKNTILFDFAQLCSGPRSQRDYMELADHYKHIAVDKVPRFTFKPKNSTQQGVEDGYQRNATHQHESHLDNEARRFIALIDECYDRGCLLILNAADEPERLYQAELLKFPFQRCVSRIIEMQSW
ncbi:MAG: cell division protein ZapE [Idiomarinaceae bacterium]|nr:cell division protein ZapE [Idiomarinaceae bacterium]